MAISFTHLSPEGLRHLVKDLRRALAKEGVKLPQNRAQEVLAQTLGHATWHEAQQLTQTSRPLLPPGKPTAPLSASEPLGADPTPDPLLNPLFGFMEAEQAAAALTPLMVQPELSGWLVLVLDAFKRRLEDARQEYVSDYPYPSYDQLTQDTLAQQRSVIRQALSTWEETLMKGGSAQRATVLRTVFTEHYPARAEDRPAFAPWLESSLPVSTWGLTPLSKPETMDAFFSLASRWGTHLLTTAHNIRESTHWLQALHVLVGRVADQVQRSRQDTWDLVKLPWFEAVTEAPAAAALTLVSFCRPDGQLGLLKRKIQHEKWAEANVLVAKLYGGREQASSDPATRESLAVVTQDGLAGMAMLRREHTWPSTWKGAVWQALTRPEAAGNLEFLLKEGKAIRALDDQRLTEAGLSKDMSFLLRQERQAVRQAELGTLLVQAVPEANPESMRLLRDHLVEAQTALFALRVMAHLDHPHAPEMGRILLNEPTLSPTEREAFQAAFVLDEAGKVNLALLEKSSRRTWRR